MKSCSDITIKVGSATCGRSVGAGEVYDSLLATADELGFEGRIIEAGCLGHCYAEPLCVVGNDEIGWKVYGYMDRVSARLLIDDLVNGMERQEFLLVGTLDETGAIISDELAARNAVERRIALRNCGCIDPLSVDDYLAVGGYEALRKAFETGPKAVLEQIEASRLRGRGGAGFPTGVKWRSCAETQSDVKYVICNADEGDPGAFMDRTLLESDPQSVIEGMIIAGFAVGASKGIVYVRAEYPLATERMEAAVEQATDAGYLGDDILGSGFGFTIEVFSAAGAFVCGEETAMIASLEGGRGIPYPRPPHPAVSGLHGKPSVIDNVKTLAYVRHIIVNGAEWFASIGTEDSTGTAVFALAGSVANPGLTEVPMGTTLRQIVYDVGGGIADPNYGHSSRKHSDITLGVFQIKVPKPIPDFKCIQVGGPSGGCIPESLLDTPVDFDSLQEAGAMMGSGGIVVMTSEDCMVETARYFLEFTCGESCGKCTFCRVGTQQMLAILEKLTRGEGCQDDLDELERIAASVQQGSACNLGRTAPNPVLTTLRYFRDEYEAHFEERCPALVCKELISYEFDDVGCASVCDECSIVCDAITSSTGYDGLRGIFVRMHDIDDELCTRCGICKDSCCGNNLGAVHKVTPAKRKKAVAHA